MNNNLVKIADNKYLQIVYTMMRTKLFMPVGLELNCTSVFFETNDNFILKDMTFAYYNPINNSIHINIEHPFFTSCSNDIKYEARLAFILFHEAMHKILMHTPQRLADKNPQLWNIASDYEVHNMYYIFSQSAKNNQFGDNEAMLHYLNEIDNILVNSSSKNKNQSESEPDFLFDKEFLDKIAEEIYCLLENSKEISNETFNFSFNHFMQNNENDNENNSSETNNKTNSANSKNNLFDDNNLNNEQNSTTKKNTSKNDQFNTKNDVLNNNNANTNENSNGQFAGQKFATTNGGKGANSKSADNLEVSVTKTTYKLPNGKKYTTIDIKWPDQKQLPENYRKSEDQLKQEHQNRTLNKSLIENNFSELEKTKGTMSSECQKFLKKLFHIKIDWVKILRNSLQTVLEKSDYFAWHKIRTSSFLMSGMPYLPDIVEDEEKYGTLIISRDESGSMTDNEIAKAGGIILDAKAFYKKIVLIKHDTNISKIYEFEDLNDDVINCLKNRESCGGTSHKEVFEYIRDYSKNHQGETVSCYIGISDLESDIQEYQNEIPSNIPIIWLAPMEMENRFNDIKGKIIPVEL